MLEIMIADLKCRVAVAESLCHTFTNCLAIRANDPKLLTCFDSVNPLRI